MNTCSVASSWEATSASFHRIPHTEKLGQLLEETGSKVVTTPYVEPNEAEAENATEVSEKEATRYCGGVGHQIAKTCRTQFDDSARKMQTPPTLDMQNM